jgi:hypothetical protein
VLGLGLGCGLFWGGYFRQFLREEGYIWLYKYESYGGLLRILFGSYSRFHCGVAFFVDCLSISRSLYGILFVLI